MEILFAKAFLFTPGRTRGFVKLKAPKTGSGVCTPDPNIYDRTYYHRGFFVWAFYDVSNLAIQVNILVR